MLEKPSSVRSFHDTISHYQQLRRAAHHFTEERFKDYAICMREIAYADVLEADRWTKGWTDAKKRPDWEWERLYQGYQSNTGTKRFDAAITVGGVLCALCYGIPTRAKLTLKIHSMARNPGKNPIQGKVLRIMLFAAVTYARLLGCKEIWLCNPMNDELTGIYENAGYRAMQNRFGNTTHLVMELNYE